MKYSLEPSTFYIQRAEFNQLTLPQFYQVAKLRQDVFIIEQNSIYQDLDDQDVYATHFLCWSSEHSERILLGYARYRNAVAAKKYKIERVVLHATSRGKGIGQQLMHKMIADIRGRAPEAIIALSAQCSVTRFYQELGFIAQGEPYDDGGIAHIDMVYSA